MKPERTLARMCIGGCGLIVGAALVLALHGAAISGAQRLEMAQERVNGSVTASAKRVPQDLADARTNSAISYPRM